MHLRPVLLAAALVAAVLSVLGGRAAAADDPSLPPTPAERAAYWLDRATKGPEPSAYAPRNFHQALLEDAVAGLVATPQETLDLLADDARRARLQEQDDANPWHAILEVLRQIGAARPEVARAWALPAFDRTLMTLRRAALTTLATLRSKDDGPVLLAALERDAEDRVVGPAAIKALLALGPPWDAAAARVAYERGIADAPGAGSGLWDPMPQAILESKTPAADDLLAWWATMTAMAGPRAKAPQGLRSREGSPAAGWAWKEDLLGVGRGAAVWAHAALALRGHAGWREALEADARGEDPRLGRVAQEALWVLSGPAGRPAFLKSTAEFLDRMTAPGALPPTQDAIEEAAARIRVLAKAPDAEGDALLLRFVLESPPFARGPREGAYDALAAHGAAPVESVAALLASGDPSSVDRALTLIQHGADRGYLAPLLAWQESPGAGTKRYQGRRIWSLLLAHAVSHGGMEPERLADGVRRILGWAKDPKDPSAAGLLGVLVDLPPLGLAAIADGLRGPDRETHLALLQRHMPRPFPPEVVDAILAPLGRDTPVAARRRALDAAFFTAGGDSAEGLRAAARRLGDDGAAEAETIARIVAHRAASDR